MNFSPLHNVSEYFIVWVGPQGARNNKAKQ